MIILELSIRATTLITGLNITGQRKRKKRDIITKHAQLGQHIWYKGRRQVSMIDVSVFDEKGFRHVSLELSIPSLK